MLRLLERNIATVEDRLVLVAPPHVNLPSQFENVSMDPRRHQDLVRQMQRLRGSVYLQDGAVRQDQLTDDGLHQTPEDEKSWHLLMLNGRGKVNSCAWYMEHDVMARFEDLRVRNCPLVRAEGWRDQVRSAIEAELDRARAQRLRYAEVGGWAVARGSRCTSEGLLLALAAYSLGRTLGGALGLTTATVRHSSSTILRRLGGALLEVGGAMIPPYYDPGYECEMELLRFDSREPSRKYRGLIDLLGGKLQSVQVVTRQAAVVVPTGGNAVAVGPAITPFAA